MNRYTAPLLIAIAAGLVALMVMNPTGFLFLLADFGMFIAKAILCAIEVIIAVVYWAIKVMAVAICNAFIALVNLMITLVNAILGWLVKGLGWALGVDLEWKGVPLFGYIRLPDSPYLRDILAELGHAWRDLSITWQNYWNRANSWAPWSWLVGGGAGAGTAATGLKTISGEGYEEARRKARKKAKQLEKMRGDIPWTV